MTMVVFAVFKNTVDCSKRGYFKKELKQTHF